MLPTLTEFEAILQRLRQEQTESPSIDGKENLFLITEGDRADLIRHIAALANNVEPSYLIIGVQDKTWYPVGLADDSPLRNPDETQRQINSLLQRRLDPHLSIRYRTYELAEKVYGLIAVKGTRAPYIIAIEETSYGGARTKGEPRHIYRGAIYVRRGSSTVIANRQSEVLGTVAKAQQRLDDTAQPDEFLAAAHYLDVESAEFGTHPLSNGLLEVDARTSEYCRAHSWVSFVFSPTDRDCEIDTVALRQRLRPDQRSRRGPEWYHGIPLPFAEMFYVPHSATPREYLGRWSPLPKTVDGITNFFRVRRTGHIEIGSTYPLFFTRQTLRCFGFVGLVGYLWQMVYLSQTIYQDSECLGEIRIFANLVGTEGTRLADFEKSWLSPFDAHYIDQPQDMCADPNIQIEQRLSLANASDDEIEATVRDVAKVLGTYYGQDQPRCFNPKTNDFPHRDYRRYCGA